MKSTNPKAQISSQFPTHPLLSQPPSSTPSSTAAISGKPAKEKKLLPTDDLEKFKREVEGSDLSKVGLIEVLKKKFPGRTAPMIKNTLEAVAKRMGNKEADKRWVLIDGGN
jgi:chromatin assembly factor 1 subunit A